MVIQRTNPFLLKETFIPPLNAGFGNRFFTYDYKIISIFFNFVCKSELFLKSWDSRESLARRAATLSVDNYNEKNFEAGNNFSTTIWAKIFCKILNLMRDDEETSITVTLNMT